VKRPAKSVSREPQTAQAALKSRVSPLMRQFRKIAALRACLKALPEEVEGLAAPYDVRLAPSPHRAAGANDALADVNTMYLYVDNATVAAALQRRRQKLINTVNATLPVAVVEELHFEIAPKKVKRQLNILALKPD